MKFLRLWKITEKQKWLLKEKREYWTVHDLFQNFVILFFRLVFISIFQ